MQSQVNDKQYAIEMSDDEDLDEVLLDYQDDEDLEELLRDFRVSSRLH